MPSTRLLAVVLVCVFSHACQLKDPYDSLSLSNAELRLARANGLEPEVLSTVKKVFETSLDQLDYRVGELTPAEIGGVQFSTKQDTVEKQFEPMRAQLAKKGYRLYMLKYGLGDPVLLGVLRSDDPYKILRLRDTTGVNYGLDTDDVIAGLEIIRAHRDFVIVAVDYDAVKLHFFGQSRDLEAVTTFVSKFCPDVAGVGSEGRSILRAAIADHGILTLWWD